MRPKHFRQHKMSIEGHTNAKLYIFKLILFFQGLVSQERSTMTKAQIYEQVQTVLDEFVNRMTSQRADGEEKGAAIFHGGSQPDAVDFRAFSIM